MRGGRRGWGDNAPVVDCGPRDSPRRRFCQRQFERVEGVFKRLAERPLLPFRDHKQALDRRGPGLDFDDDLNIAVGRRRSGARGAGAASPRLGCHLVQRDPNLLKLLVQLLLVV
jgi:hypothetical protein